MAKLTVSFFQTADEKITIINHSSDEQIEHPRTELVLIPRAELDVIHSLVAAAKDADYAQSVGIGSETVTKLVFEHVMPLIHQVAAYAKP
jgi:hypothetical protein